MEYLKKWQRICAALAIGFTTFGSVRTIEHLLSPEKETLADYFPVILLFGTGLFDLANYFIFAGQRKNLEKLIEEFKKESLFLDHLGPTHIIYSRPLEEKKEM
ncbi:hypothetical protein A3C98_03505 [Candidatus Roizmanbacteria bacterium RIFCSPHIGHO2_02_FULL_37_15]|nr:MAG: hypothetical protein A2859_05220 [Candidatus Roizmanbacteria bacterium RIFCSPHIGHO2_01_FULL_37_16b]OGK20439.1 MAG: hypothetical protein A3C98_03505 [Candidatus Roizmanbacteria bacterium RIFCSPHIGHO2_02_FULL_37_15]OGK34040.1 MAG: hypothetical protein A3F57_02455 [Candidatus Roizmanbacteria bacterium RIFCSPHIGHO2_12_FULL_36_11]